VMRKLRYILNLRDTAMKDIFKMGNLEIDQSRITALLKKDDENGFVICSDEILNKFLEGLIVFKRGKKEPDSQTAEKKIEKMTNNIIFRKIRIALELKDDDILAVLKLTGTAVSKSELSALFRKAGHRNYKECGDQLLRNFLKGLSLKLRPKDDLM
jgi:uncharacterized protein YehS (DUF1456 family)